jgi:hypothetical protein
VFTRSVARVAAISAIVLTVFAPAGQVSAAGGDQPLVAFEPVDLSQDGSHVRDEVLPGSALLALAEEELRRGDFKQAYLHAEMLLRPRASQALRTPALLVAADAAAELGWSQLAGKRYQEFISRFNARQEAFGSPSLPTTCQRQRAEPEPARC